MVEADAENSTENNLGILSSQAVSGEYDGIHYDVMEPNHATSILKIVLDEGQSMRATLGSMLAMSDNVSMVGKMKKSFKSLLAPSDARYQEFSTTTGEGWVILSPGFFGTIRAICLGNDKDEICVSENAFLASIGDINVTSKGQGLKKAVMNQGMFLKSFKGKGIVFVSAVGSFMPFYLSDGQSIILNRNSLVSWSASMKYDCVKAGTNWLSTAVAGEGYVAKLSGPGTINVQTRHGEQVAEWIYDAKTPPSSPLPLQ